VALVLSTAQAGDWLIHYDPDYRIYPDNLYKAMVATASSRLKLSPNGTFLSDMYPRPATAAAWRAGAVQHPAAAKAAAPTADPDCLNLGCQSKGTNASWVRSAINLLDRDSQQDSTLGALSAPSRLPDAVLNISSSVIQLSSNWLSAARNATLSLGGFGDSTNSSTMGLGTMLSLTPMSAVASDLVNTLRQVVNVANNLLGSLASGMPSQPVWDATGALTATAGAAGSPSAVAAAAAAAQAPVGSPAWLRSQGHIVAQSAASKV
jgi:hypothetical protein